MRLEYNLGIRGNLGIGVGGLGIRCQGEGFRVLALVISLERRD